MAHPFRLLAAVLVGLCLSNASLSLMGGAPAGSHGDQTADHDPAPTRSILIEPNSGTEPESFGDRGGLGQTLLFFLIVGVVTAGGLHIAHHARRSRAALTAAGWISEVDDAASGPKTAQLRTHTPPGPSGP